METDIRLCGLCEIGILDSHCENTQCTWQRCTNRECRKVTPKILDEGAQ